jgi:hypothetical protein
MSAHFSKFGLNTYYQTPYFQAHAPATYPLGDVLVKGRAFRRLPPRLRELSALAKGWASRSYPYPAGIMGIERWYDPDGYELDPDTGRRLTDAEIDADWDRVGQPRADPGSLPDIPVPPGGFADPMTWQEPPPPPDPDSDLDDPGITLEKLVEDIGSHGRDYVAKEYGVPRGLLAGVASDTDLARLILGKLGSP